MDDLGSAGAKTSTLEEILYILNGLDSDFEAIVAVISSQLELIPMVRTLLMIPMMQIYEIPKHLW